MMPMDDVARARQYNELDLLGAAVDRLQTQITAPAMCLSAMCRLVQQCFSIKSITYEEWLRISPAQSRKMHSMQKILRTWSGQSENDKDKDETRC